MKSRIIKVSSVFPAVIDAVWGKLQRLDTLQYIARPYASFKPIDTKGLTWREGETSRFSLRLFGFLPLGVHSITVVTFDRDTLIVQTHEGNKSVPVWNHRITLRPYGEGKTQYTDEVEMFAGWATPIVCAWSAMFYRHRQRKWRKLLKTSR